MNNLTIVVSNRDRLDPKSPATQYFFGSLERQSCLDFEMIIVDGGSRNIEELEKYIAKPSPIKKKLICHSMGKFFERSLLNNVGIRNAETKYVMASDADMLYGRNFIKVLNEKLSPFCFVESRTLFLKEEIASKIYDGKLDFYNNENSCKKGRLMRRTTCGGCQAASLDNWNKLRGYNEKMVGWGPEDQELLKRACHLPLSITWLGETIETIMLFHQPHPKNQEQLITNAPNKHILNNEFTMDVNKDGWGGKP